MQPSRIALKGVLLFTVTLLTLSCTSSIRLADDWKDPAFTETNYKSIMVIALAKRADLRQSFEEEFVKQMKARSLKVSISSESIPDVDKVTREEIVKAGTGTGVEAFLLLRLLRVDIQVQSYRASTPSASASSAIADSLVTMHWGPADPPMTKRTEVATLELRLYDAKSSNLVWRSTVDAVNTSGESAEIEQFVRLVMKTLDSEKLIARP
jgi:hypothetical protein